MFADQRLRNPKDALDPSNRRISLIVHYIETDTSGSDDSKATSPAESKAGSPTPEHKTP